jgi:hypothetical protein
MTDISTKLNKVVDLRKFLNRKYTKPITFDATKFIDFIRENEDELMEMRDKNIFKIFNNGFNTDDKPLQLSRHKKISDWGFNTGNKKLDNFFDWIYLRLSRPKFNEDNLEVVAKKRKHNKTAKVLNDILHFKK